MLKKMCCVTLTMLAAGTASAMPIVNNWSFDLTTQWDTSSVIWSGAAPATAPTTDTLTWGTGSSGPSSLVISDGVITGGSITTNGAIANTSTVTHNNNPITGSTLLSVMLNTSLTLTPLDNTGGPENPPVGSPQTIDFSVFFAETPNNTSNPDDIFVLSGAALENSFTYNGNTYLVETLNLSGQLGPLTEDQCMAAGVDASSCFGWTTPEGASTAEQFGLRITSQVPTPAPLALLAVGLLTLVGRQRMRSTVCS